MYVYLTEYTTTSVAIIIIIHRQPDTRPLPLISITSTLHARERIFRVAILPDVPITAPTSVLALLEAVDSTPKAVASVPQVCDRVEAMPCIQYDTSYILYTNQRYCNKLSKLRQTY